MRIHTARTYLSILASAAARTCSAADKMKAGVIFLHGLGWHAEGTDGVGIAANLIKLPGVKWVFPDAPTMPVTVEGGKNIPSVRLFLLILVWAI